MLIFSAHIICSFSFESTFNNLKMAATCLYSGKSVPDTLIWENFSWYIVLGKVFRDIEFLFFYFF